MPALVNGDYVIGVAISEGNLLDFKVITWLYNVLYMQITNVGNNDGVLQLTAETEPLCRKHYRQCISLSSFTSRNAFIKLISHKA